MSAGEQDWFLKMREGYLADEETVRFSQCWHKESRVAILKGGIRSIKKAEPGFSFTLK